MMVDATASELRETGISVIGDLHWGTHFCCFYETKADLLETLVVYFKAGLRNNEFCVWVVSQQLTKEEARHALRQAVPELDRHLKEGRLEIHGHDEWYLSEGRCDPQRVLQSWRDKLNLAFTNGYDGLRASGDGGWFQENEWIVFREYEREVEGLIADRRRLLLCTYPLTTSSGGQVFDLACTHQVAVARRNGRWETIETSELKQAKAEIKRLNEELEQKVEERTRELATTVEAVKRAEDRIRLVIDTIPTMAWTLAPDGTVDFVNQRWLDYTGLSFEDAIRDPNRIVHSDDLPPAVEKWLRKMAGGNLHEVEVRLRRTDGEYRWFLVRVAPLRDAYGNVVKWYGVSTDIEDRKQAEMQSRALIDAIPHQIWSGPADGTLDYCNERWRSYVGLEQDDLCGHGWQSVLHPDDRERVLTAWQESVANGAPYEEEERHRGADGIYRWFLSRAVPLRDAEGHIVRWYGTNTDIEDRKRAEEELKREKEILAKIFDNIPVMIGFVSADGGVKLVNREWERTIGWTLKELRDQKVDIFAEAYPDLSYRQDVLDFVASATGESTDLKIKVRNGHVIDAACAVVRLSDGTKVAIAQDITERKRAAEALEAANHQLRILSRQLFHIQEEERRHLARELHDEIGQTLTAAKINLKIIAPEVPAEVAGRLNDSVQLLDRLLTQVRELSLDLRPPLLDELGLVPTLRWLVDHRAQRAGLRVTFSANLDGSEIEPDVQTTCFRVVQEALTNIIRHSGAKNVAVDLGHELEGLTLSVRDDGAGFDPAAIQQRTAPDFTLGLVSMKERALLVRGGFEVHSAPGQGTEIRAWFPLAPGARPSTEIL